MFALVRRFNPSRVSLNFRQTIRSYSTNNLPAWFTELKEETSNGKFPEEFELEWYNEPELKSFHFDEETWNHTHLLESDKVKLCGGANRQYLLVGQSYTFPDFRANPVKYEPVHPSYLWLDPSSSTPKILFQPFYAVPPLLWIPIRPKSDSLKRLFDDIMEVEAGSVAANIYEAEEMLKKVELKEDKDNPQTEEEAKAARDRLLDFINTKDPSTIRDEHPNTANLFIGNIDDLKNIEQSLMNNPLVFNTPILLGSSNKHTSKSPVLQSKFRTVFSRSVITIEARNDLNVELGDGGSTSPEMVLPLFARINYPNNERFSVPGPARYNKIFGTDYPSNMPVDVLIALHGSLMKDYRSIRAEIQELEQRDEQSDVIGINIAHLAILRDPDFETIFERYHTHEKVLVRIACLKGAAELGLKKQVVRMLENDTNSDVQSLAKQIVEKW